jgi:hypothetical protein
MKHKGKATKAGFKMILWTFVAVAVVWAVGAFIVAGAAVIATVALALTPFLFVFWVVFAFFTLYFFAILPRACGNQPGCVPGSRQSGCD